MNTNLLYVDEARQNIKALIDPQTPEEWSFALQNPLSPLHTMFLNILAENIAKEDRLTILLDRWFDYTQKKDKEERECILKEEINQEIRNQKLIQLQNIPPVTYLSQHPPIPSLSGLDELKRMLDSTVAYLGNLEDKLNELDTKITEINNEIPNKTDKVEKNSTELHISDESRADKIIAQLPKIQFKFDEDAKNTVALNEEQAKCLHPIFVPPPLAKKIKINPYVAKQEAKTYLAGQNVLEQLKYAYKIYPMLFPDPKQDTPTPAEILKFIKANKNLRNMPSQNQAQSYIDKVDEALGLAREIESDKQKVKDLQAKQADLVLKKHVALKHKEQIDSILDKRQSPDNSNQPGHQITSNG